MQKGRKKERKKKAKKINGKPKISTKQANKYGSTFIRSSLRILCFFSYWKHCVVIQFSDPPQQPFIIFRWHFHFYIFQLISFRAVNLTFLICYSILMICYRIHRCDSTLHMFIIFILEFFFGGKIGNWTLFFRKI